MFPLIVLIIIMYYKWIFLIILMNLMINRKLILKKDKLLKEYTIILKPILIMLISI